MINPALSDAEWRSMLMRRMFWQSGLAEGTYLGIGLIVGGLILVMVKRSGDPTPDPGHEIRWTLVVALVLFVLAIGVCGLRLPLPL